MDLFVTSESTRGIEFDDIRELIRIEDIFNGLVERKEIAEYEKMAVVFIVMDPKVARPFPEGVIVRRSRRMIDLKIRLDYDQWIIKNRLQKLVFAIESIIAFLSSGYSQNISPLVRSKIARVLLLSKNSL